jgi:hypothetical protein
MRKALAGTVDTLNVERPTTRVAAASLGVFSIRTC